MRSSDSTAVQSYRPAATWQHIPVPTTSYARTPKGIRFERSRYVARRIPVISARPRTIERGVFPPTPAAPFGVRYSNICRSPPQMPANAIRITGIGGLLDLPSDPPRSARACVRLLGHDRAHHPPLLMFLVRAKDKRVVKQVAPGWSFSPGVVPGRYRRICGRPLYRWYRWTARCRNEGWEDRQPPRFTCSHW